MFPPKTMRSVGKSVRNLPEDPAVDPNAPPAAPEKPAGMTCPNCGCALDLQAVAKPGAAEPPAAVQAPAGEEGPNY